MHNNANDATPHSEHRNELSTGDKTDIAAGVAVLVLIYGGLVWFAYWHNGGADREPLVLCGLVAASAGWLAGILASPYNPEEQSAFGDMGKLIYGFVTGWVLGKVDPLLTHALAVDTGNYQHSLVYIGFGMTSFFIAAAFTYISRKYWIASGVAPTQRRQDRGSGDVRL
jgi:hypothetical protein